MNREKKANGNEVPVHVPPELLPILGVCDEGTRVYRAHGPESGVGQWYETLHEYFGAMVSPGGVSMFAPVTRAGVHARIKRGQLTIFLYHVEHLTTSLVLRRPKVKTEARPYVYIPVSECKAWGNELLRRKEELAKRIKETPAGSAPGELVQAVEAFDQEAGGEKKDWNDSFLDWPKRSEANLRGRPRRDNRD